MKEQIATLEATFKEEAELFKSDLLALEEEYEDTGVKPIIYSETTRAKVFLRRTLTYKHTPAVEKKAEKINNLKKDLKALKEKEEADKNNLISEELLITNFTEDKFIEESLSMEPPFFLTLLSGSDIGVSIEQDTLNPYVKYLNPGTELNLEGFISKSELLFTNTNKLKIRLNGVELDLIKNYPYPLKLIIKSSPSSFTAKLYKPIN